MDEEKKRNKQSLEQSTGVSFSTVISSNYLWIALFVLTVLVRLVHLSADPPIGLSTSQGVYTDPAAYTMYAKNAELFGNYNPLSETRFPLFQNSAVTPVARAVFAVFGVGYAQANFSGLLFSMLTILLLCLLVRKHHGPAAVFFMLTFLVLNKNQFFYGRLPFLENPMVFFGVLSFWLAESSREKRIIQVLAGVALSASFLLGKSHGIVFVGVFSGFFLWRLLIATTQERVGQWKRIIAFGSGLFLGSAMWLATIGWPNFDAISYYLAEQSTGLYGPPEAFESVANFFWKLFSLGADIEGLTVAALLAFVLMVTATYRLLVGHGENGAKSLSGTTVFMALWVILIWVELFAWNYRPLRYLIPLTYPVCALAGIALARLLASTREKQATKAVRNWSFTKPLIAFYLVFGFALIFPVYQIWLRISVMQTDDFSFDDSKWYVVATASALWLVFLAYERFWRRGDRFQVPSRLATLILVVAPAIALGSGLSWYISWAQRPTYSIVSVSEDLPKILGPDAVISGPYGVGLAQDNVFPALVHQFGVSDPDTTFLDDFPVTHLLLDESNMTRFRDMYPVVAARSFPLHTYHITNLKVTLIRISGATKNLKARAYQLSAFEIGQLVLDGRIKDPSGRAVAGMMNIDSSNIAVNLYLARRAETIGAIKEARFFLTCASDASPTDYDTQAELGRINLALYNQSGSDMFLREKFLKSSLERFRLAHHLNPGAEKITAKLAEVEALR